MVGYASGASNSSPSVVATPKRGGRCTRIWGRAEPCDRLPARSIRLWKRSCIAGRLAIRLRCQTSCARPTLEFKRVPELAMTYVVTENCIKCKYTDCVEVCPVDCFYEGENMLVIHPDECIDCGVCEPECPVDAIKPDTSPGLRKGPRPNRQTPEPWRNTTR